jgi:hypothetical protein
MRLIAFMRKTDDEPTRWTSIGWQALLITNRLRNAAQLVELTEDKNVDGRDKSDAGTEREKVALEQREFVERRLREIGRFEDRARGERRK